MTEDEDKQGPDPWTTALEGLDLVVLDPAACRFATNLAGNLCGTIAGREHDLLAVYRTHPLSAPAEWISVVVLDDLDSDGHRSDGSPGGRVEVGVLPDLEGLDPPSRQAVETALWLRYFMPTVVRITAVAEESPGQNGAVVWELDTDRGYMRLRMANLFEGIEQLPSGRIVLSDRDGNRAHIPDAAGLDPQSRRLLERYYWF